MIRKIRLGLLGIIVLFGIGACADHADLPSAPEVGKAVGAAPRLAPATTNLDLVAGPYIFQRAEPGGRGTMRPLFEEVMFEVADPASWEEEFVLRLHSGPEPKGPLSSAVVILNGEMILGPDDFDGTPLDLEIPVTLLAQNDLAVKIAGGPGSVCEIRFEGVPRGELHAMVLYPGLASVAATAVPLTVRASCQGWIGDDQSALPEAFRMLLVPAVWNGSILRTRADFEAHVADLIVADHPDWSDWQAYAPTMDGRSRVYAGLEPNSYYLLAVQVRDAAGRVSAGLGYQREVLHLRALENYFRPVLEVWEAARGVIDYGAGALPVAAGEELVFSWLASASQYNGVLASYRHGWDLADPEDPNDPGWAVAPGLAPENLAAAPVQFVSGQHRLTIRVEDDFGQVKVGQVLVDVMPVARGATRDLAAGPH